MSLRDETEFVPSPLDDEVEAVERPKKILTCDDERNIVRLVEVNLKRVGFDVVTAYNGRECLERVAEEKPDLIVLDLMMPEMTGFEVLEVLKADPETADIPVIMLTARTQDEDVLRGWQAGVECYLTKPFVVSELITFIKRVFMVTEEEELDDRRLEL